MANAMVTVLEHCRVSPPQLDHNSNKLLPLTFFDIFWLNWPSSSLVYFYDFPCSTTEFTQTIVPCLKNSLAITLQHYFPLCGNLIIPATPSNTSTTPAIRCLNGDSVSLTIAEFSGSSTTTTTTTVSEGFRHLSGNHAREVNELLVLVPQLPPGDITEDGNVVISAVFSLQLTLFPDHGFSIGLTNSHVVVDGKTMSYFMRTWASISAKQLNNSEDDYYGRIINNLPFYDRSVIKDTKGIASIFLRARLRMAEENSKAFAPPALEKDTVQATFKMNRAQIQGLKTLVSAQVPHVSTFVVVCAYVWTCMTKARAALQQDQMNDDFEVEEHFFIGMDTRARLDPPIPSNYFGNAILTGRCTLKSSQLLGGEEGFLNAVEEIRKTLDGKTNNEEGVLKGFEMFFDHIEAMKGQRKFGVAGSPKFDNYSIDFGWGKPNKYDFISKKFALSGSRDSNDDLEIGLCFSKDEMNAFTTIFAQGLIS